MNEKQRLRKELLAARKAMPAEEKAWRDAAIAKHFLAWLERNPAASIGVYWPHMGEPDLTPVYPDLTVGGSTLALPVVIERDAPLAFYPWRPGEELIKDAHGVMAPAARFKPVQPALLLLPCLGFTATRFRLGYGGGYYDRTLAAARETRTVGIAYATGKTDFKVDRHDIALNNILTELGDPD